MPVTVSRSFVYTVLRGLSALAVVVAVSACTPRVDPRGNLPDAERLAEIVPGEHSRDEVSEILGTPSTIGNFDGETWLYISEQTETLAFFERTLKERQVVILRFDAEGIVKSIETIDATAGKDFEPVDRETPTEGNRITVMEQLLGKDRKSVV